eukprot:gene12801-12929_t
MSSSDAEVAAEPDAGAGFADLPPEQLLEDLQDILGCPGIYDSLLLSVTDGGCYPGAQQGVQQQQQQEPSRVAVYPAVAGLDPAAGANCLAVHPHWTLCRFEARGRDADATCAYQHWADMQLSVTGVEEQLGRLLRGTGVPAAAAAAVAGKWKTQHLHQQQPNGGLKTSLQVIQEAAAAWSIDWMSLLSENGAEAAAASRASSMQQQQVRKVDAMARAAVMDAAVPTADVLVQHSLVPEGSSGISGGASDRGQLQQQQQVDQQYQPQLEEGRRNPDFWLSWALDALDGTWQQQALVLLKAVAYLAVAGTVGQPASSASASRTTAADGTGAGAGAASSAEMGAVGARGLGGGALSCCLLDVALRLLAAAGLAANMQQHPVQATILWQSMCCALAAGRLPLSAECRLQYQQQLFVLSKDEVAGTAAAAAGSGGAAPDMTECWEMAQQSLQIAQQQVEAAARCLSVEGGAAPALAAADVQDPQQQSLNTSISVAPDGLWAAVRGGQPSMVAGAAAAAPRATAAPVRATGAASQAAGGSLSGRQDYALRLLLQLLLGGAASGWLEQQDVESLSAALSASRGRLQVLEALEALQDKQLLPEPSQVRKAFYVLLHQQSAPQGKAASVLAAVQGQVLPAALCVQRCLAYLNWALYEANVGELQRAGSILLAALAEARDHKQQGLVALLQHHFLVYLCRLDSMGGSAAAIGPLVGKGAGGRSSVVQVLHAIVSGTGAFSGGCTAGGRVTAAQALQYPELSFSSPQLSQRLLPPPLLEDAVLEANLQGLLALLPRKQVVQAVLAHPWSQQLWQLHHDTAGTLDLRAVIMLLADRHGLKLAAKDPPTT